MYFCSMSLPWQALCPPDITEGSQNIPASIAGTSLHHRKREIGNCQQRGSVVCWAPCPWLALLYSNYRHLNDLLTPGTGRSSLFPGIRQRAERETEAQKNKMITHWLRTKRSQSWLVQNWVSSPFCVTLSSTSSGWHWSKNLIKTHS